jgi:hypothetical protein
VAEQQLMRTRDALLCNQVIRTNQFIFSVLTPLITWSPAGAFFCSSVHSLQLSIITMHTKFGKTWSQ